LILWCTFWSVHRGKSAASETGRDLPFSSVEGASRAIRGTGPVPTTVFSKLPANVDS